MKAVVVLAALAACAVDASAQVSGFLQARVAQRLGSIAACSLAGCRTMVEEVLAELLVERRLGEHAALAVRAEAVHDDTSRDARLALREGTLALQPTGNIDVKVGRQIITWGVSDYLYVNDIFPKNYDAFFTGGSFDRIKEPVDAVHLTWHGRADWELVASKSRADRLPSPSRFTAVGPAANAVPADDAHGSKVDVAIKASTSLGGWDVAVYAASLRSREPRDFVDAGGLRFDTPRLQHAGFSITGNAAAGVVWMEAALRHVDTDRPGVVDRHFLGSSAKIIAGYSKEIAEEVTASAQVQLESALARDRYVRALAPGIRPLPVFDPTLHLRVIGHWANQTIGAGAQLFAGAEGDTHFNPFVNWSPVDGWTLEGGANIFGGRPDTRFGALRRDSNVYASVRYSY